MILSVIYNAMNHIKQKRLLKHLRRKAENEMGCSISPQTQIDESTAFEENVSLAGGVFFGSHIGRHSFAGNAFFPKTKIGRFCSIAGGAHLILGSHPTSFVSSWPGFFRTINGRVERFNDEASFSELILTDDGFYCEIGNDVWVGQDCAIMSGVRIGDGAIIGANALVTKDIPPYAIVGGVPAKIIRFRFSEDIIQTMLSVRWWDWDDKTIRKYCSYFDSPSRLFSALKNDGLLPL